MTKNQQKTIKKHFLKNTVHFLKMNSKFGPPRPPELLFNHRPHLFCTGPRPQMPTFAKVIVNASIFKYILALKIRKYIISLFSQKEKYGPYLPKEENID